MMRGGLTSKSKRSTSYSTFSKNSKKTYTADEMKEMEDKLKDAWKVLGRDTQVGRDMYRLYGKGHKPTIDVPTPNTKPWDYRQAAMKEKKPCPQQAKVEYPPVVTKQDLLRQKYMKKFTKLDLIPKRKAMGDIQSEIDLLKQEKRSYIPKNRGVDRKGMINDLQEKFKYGNKTDDTGLTAEEEEKIRLAVEAQMRAAAKKNYFGNYGLVKDAPKDPNQLHPPVDKNTHSSIELQQLDELFEAVIEEIEERQSYLASIEGYEMHDTKERIKGEIASRVAELQKINAMIKQEKDRIDGGQPKQSTTIKSGLRR